MEGTILIVDDEEALSRLISYNLAREGFSVITASDGHQALELIRIQQPDLIILDVMLPGKDGLELCQELRRANNATPIIMLSAKGEEIDKVVGLEMGANDYVTKPFSVKELIARTKAHLRRYREDCDENLQNGNIKIGSFTIHRDKYEIYFNEQLLNLTVKEYELLDLLIRNRGRVLTRDYLIESLYDLSDSVNTRVLDVHIGKLRNKIESDTQNPRYIKTVRGLGYKYGENEDV